MPLRTGIAIPRIATSGPQPADLGVIPASPPSGHRFFDYNVRWRFDHTARPARHSGDDRFLGIVVPALQARGPGPAEAYESYRGMPVEFIGIDVRTPNQDAPAHIELYGIAHTNGPDENGSVTVEYGIWGIPERLFVNRGGIPAKKIIAQMGSRSLTAAVDELLDATLIDIPAAP